MATEEQRRPEVDAGQEAEGGLDLRGRRPRQPDNGFPISTIASNGRGNLSSEHKGGAKSLVEGDEFSQGSFELKNGGVDFSDPKTSPGHVILNLTTEKTSIRTDGEISQLGNEDDIKIVSTFVVPSTSSPQEQIVKDTTIDIDIRATEHGRVDSDPTTEREQRKIDHLYLASVYPKPDACEFYCPNCKACIDKVLIRSREDDEVRCPSCFEFLKPIGDWFFHRRTPATTRPEVTVRPPPPPTLVPTTSFKVPSSNSNGHAAPDTSFPTMPPAVPAPEVAARASSPTTFVPPTSSNKTPATVPPEVAARASPPTTFVLLTSSNKTPSTVPLEVPVLPSPPATLVPLTLSKEQPVSAYKNGATDSSFNKALPTVPGNQEAVSEKPEVTVGPAPPVVVTPVRPTNGGESSAVMWEILKSVVYGGLTESITSLSIVTSAASAAASTAGIVVLALANLIGGLFVIGHHLTELKNCPSQVISSETSEQVDRYQEVLGQKRNFILHATFAVLSFLVFGLVPPLVYGFSFYESDNRYLKLAAVAAASLICIIVLAIAKAYTQKPPKWYTYVTTVMYYAALGVGASGMSYLAGYLIGILIDKLGWFESTAAITLSLPGMSSVKTSRESY